MRITTLQSEDDACQLPADPAFERVDWKEHRVDLEAVRGGLNAATPLFAHLGIAYDEVGPVDAVTSVPDRPHLANHVGTQHAVVIFGVAEAAAGGAFVAAMAPHMHRIRFVARGGEVSYTAPARGPLRARAALALAPEDVVATVEREGRTRVPVTAEVLDLQGQVVATASFTYHVKHGVPTGTVPEPEPATASTGGR